MRVDESARSGGIIRICLIFYNMMVCCVFSLESPQWGDSNENTQFTVFNIKKENHTKLSQICSQGFAFLGTEERVRNNRNKRAISVRAIEVLLYTLMCLSIGTPKNNKFSICSNLENSLFKVFQNVGRLQPHYNVLEYWDT